MTFSPRPRRGGSSLAECVLVIGLLALAAGLLLPALHKVHAAADRDTCTNNLKQIVIATHNCNDTYGKLPPAAGSFPLQQGSQGTFFAYVLPFIEQDKLYKAALGGRGNLSVWTNEVYKNSIPVYLCPEDRSGGKDHRFQGWATSSYPANFLVFGDRAGNTMQGAARIPATFPDGTSNTILFAERYEVCDNQPCAWAYPGASPWTPVFGYYSTDKFQVRPAAARCDPNLAQGPHAGGINVALADGSTRFLSPKISLKTWQYACDPSDGNPPGKDW